MDEIVTQYNIRQATPEDLPQIITIDQELGGLNPMLEEKFGELHGHPEGHFLVAEFKGEVVGFAGGIIRHNEFGEADPIGYITHVGLRSDFKSKGMGRMLGDQLIEVMSEQCERFRTILGFDRIDLQSFFNHL
ncbi:MAG: N-acetyltransferase family protein, partial [Candidatus Kariarchaeaceae archaeon]